MRIKPLAFDSFGVRSMATFIETDDIRILIDPGVSLAPSRFGLPPHPIELERQAELWENVRKHAKISDVLIVTHYHYDHHNPSEPEIYENKEVYVKHPKRNINKSQRGRAAYFLDLIDPKSIEIADGATYTHGETTIKFSKPVYHGINPRLGYVIETCITDEKEKFIHTSDVEGPAMEDQVSFILAENPDTLIIDGPMTYMLGFRYSRKSLDTSIENMERIIEGTKVQTIIPDHHFMRDLKYKERISPVYEANKGKKTMSAAEYVGKSIEMLEARRKELHG